MYQHCTREQAKVLMALGAAPSSVSIRQLALRTGMKMTAVLTVCEWGVANNIIQELAGTNEYFSGSGAVVDYLTNGISTPFCGATGLR